MYTDPVGLPRTGNNIKDNNTEQQRTNTYSDIPSTSAS
jgi:hypothetical protein